jgi:hypothetical protein
VAVQWPVCGAVGWSSSRASRSCVGDLEGIQAGKTEHISISYVPCVVFEDGLVFVCVPVPPLVDVCDVLVVCPSAAPGDASDREKTLLMRASRSTPAILTGERGFPTLRGALAVSRARVTCRAVSRPISRPSSTAMGSSRTVSAVNAAWRRFRSTSYVW